jgi:ketosteroid isomerase-like protein
MSQKNVELVRSMFESWERGDLRSAEWAHPDIEFETADGPAPGRSTGLAGMAAAMREFLSAWQEWRVEADEYRALDHERVLVLQHYSARGKTSGAELGGVWAEGANLFTIREGKVTSLVCYFDRERGLEAAGLSE